MADLTFSGQTDELLTVELPSRIAYAKWRGNATSAGGVITIEVMTQWVANNSNITISIKDRDGGAVETINGKVWNNLFRKVPDKVIEISSLYIFSKKTGMNLGGKK